MPIVALPKWNIDTLPRQQEVLVTIGKPKQVIQSK